MRKSYLIFDFQSALYINYFWSMRLTLLIKLAIFPGQGNWICFSLFVASWTLRLSWWNAKIYKEISHQIHPFYTGYAIWWNYSLFFRFSFLPCLWYFGTCFLSTLAVPHKFISCFCILSWRIGKLKIFSIGCESHSVSARVI